MIEVKSEQEMQQLGERLGRLFVGGEVIELIGDVGAGKTTLVRGIARGMGIDETVQSPSFTISRLYEAPDGRRLAHYDFYRLDDPGIMKDELLDTINTHGTVVIIEWAGTVEEILPVDHLTISIMPSEESERELSVEAGGETSKKILDGIL
jgi:tRNA threonylcarbamoyladenosine biosynthesis protein TsaE